MFITNHVLAGALVGLAVRRRPFAAVIAGFASHFVLDAAPHWGTCDRRLFRRVAVADGLCGLATIALVARAVPRSHRATVFAAIVGSCLPDLDKPAVMFFGRSPFPQSFDSFHGWVQREAPHRLPHEALAAALLAAMVAVTSVAGPDEPALGPARAALSRALF